VTASGWVLAHQGGWDEILLVLTPIVLFAGLLLVANRRADVVAGQRGNDVAPETAPTDDEAPDGPDGSP